MVVNMVRKHKSTLDCKLAAGEHTSVHLATSTAMSVYRWTLVPLLMPASFVLLAMA
jgi:hypothetical protein